MTTWEEVSTGSPPVKGSQYRYTAWLRMPYSLAPRVRDLVRFTFAGAALLRIAALVSVETIPPMMSSGGAVSDRWRLVVTWKAA